jgi:DNA-binding NtrC family response regulator
MVPRVLLLEPYADLRSLIAATLQREHYVCDAVATADDATLELGRHTYQYVVVDADTTGSGALVAGLDPEAHVILLTTDSAAEGLRKPFSRAELMAFFTN